MKLLLSTEGLQALRDILASRPLVAFDFDGTLAPIVTRPEDARVPTGLARRLIQLSSRLTTAVISGRQVSDLSDRLGFEPDFVVGNHGAEDPLAGDREDWVTALDGFRSRLMARADDIDALGMVVEDKGASLAVHYRQARDRTAAAGLVDDLMADLDERLRAFGGKMVVNVMSRHANDKGRALTLLVERAGATSAVFFGDDVNDEAVFELHRPDWLTVRVGCDDRHSQADFFMQSQTDFARVLDEMLSAL